MKGSVCKGLFKSGPETAEFEREILRERERAGLADSRQNVNRLEFEV
jgi:hypothetical protein